ncbi:hypothetical protein OROMI_028656 [Orobanche minor]
MINHNKMSKATTIFVAALLFFSLCSAARPDPTSRIKVSDTGNEINEEAQVDESCHGVGEDECFMRRSLIAHIDYIYTQEKKP